MQELPTLPVRHQLEELLGDSSFVRIVDLVTKEAMRFWNIPQGTARGFVFSAIGEPATLVCIYNAWRLAKDTENFGLAKVIIRRRVIDLLRRDARQVNHCSLPVTASDLDTDAAITFNELLQRSPRAQLELQQVIVLVRGALACFAAQGRIQKRQALLLQRYALDEAPYAELSVEMECSENALRVRVHKAMLALRRHIGVCHPELEDLLGLHKRPARALHLT